MSTDQAQTDATRQVAQLLRGYVITQLIATAVRCGLPDHLGEDPVTAEEKLLDPRRDDAAPVQDQHRGRRA